MIHIYNTSKDTFVLSEKRFKETYPAAGSAETVNEAVAYVMDELCPPNGAFIKYDKDLREAVEESDIAEVEEKDFISVKRYLPSKEEN